MAVQLLYVQLSVIALHVKGRDSSVGRMVAP